VVAGERETIQVQAAGMRTQLPALWAVHLLVSESLAMLAAYAVAVEFFDAS